MRKFQDEINKHIFIKPKSSKPKNRNMIGNANTTFELLKKKNDLLNTKTNLLTTQSTKVTETASTTSSSTTVEPFRDPKKTVSGNTFSVIVSNLEYFQDYEFRVRFFFGFG